MKELLSAILPYMILLSHVLFPVLVAAILFRKSWGAKVFAFLGRYAVCLAFLLSLSAVLGSLFYSEVLGYEPCVLCWWTRVFLYPQAFIFGVALFVKGKGREAFAYALPLSVLALLLSLYFSYYSAGGASILPCTAEGGACSKVYVKEFGYVTIPMMSFTISAYLLLMTWVNKLYKNENSNAR